MNSKAMNFASILLCVIAGMLLLYGLKDIKEDKIKVETVSEEEIESVPFTLTPEATQQAPEPTAVPEPTVEPKFEKMAEKAVSVPVDPCDIDCFEFAEAVKAALPNHKLKFEEVYDYKVNLTYDYSEDFTVEEYMKIVELVKECGFTEENGFTVMDGTECTQYRMYHVSKYAPYVPSIDAVGIIHNDDEQKPPINCDVIMSQYTWTVQINFDKYYRGNGSRIFVPN